MFYTLVSVFLRGSVILFVKCRLRVRVEMYARALYTIISCALRLDTYTTLLPPDCVYCVMRVAALYSYRSRLVSRPQYLQYKIRRLLNFKTVLPPTEGN